MTIWFRLNCFWLAKIWQFMSRNGCQKFVIHELTFVFWCSRLGLWKFVHWKIYTNDISDFFNMSNLITLWCFVKLLEKNVFSSASLYHQVVFCLTVFNIYISGYKIVCVHIRKILAVYCTPFDLKIWKVHNVAFLLTDWHTYWCAKCFASTLRKCWWLNTMQFIYNLYSSRTLSEQEGI